MTRSGNKARPHAIAFATLAMALAASTAAYAQRPPTQMNPLDRSDLGRSKQDPNLRGVPIPATVTPLERVPLDRVKLPAGFKADVFAHGMPGARTMVQGPKGTIFVGSRTIGRVYAVTQKDGKTETRIIAQGLTSPNGLAIRDGSLYVFAINKVFRYDNVEDSVDKLPEPVDLSAAFNLPSDTQHGWKFVAFGPDGKLYVPVGANCNICEVNPAVHAHIRRYNADGTGMEIVARGVRNTVGFDWHPVTKELWFTDNGRDWAGDGGPEDELNRIGKGQEGASFGFPYCHANSVARPGCRKAQRLRGRCDAGRAHGAARSRARHQVLHGRHVPGEVQERGVHRAPRFMESQQAHWLRRGRRLPAEERKGEGRAVPHRLAG